MLKSVFSFCKRFFTGLVCLFLLGSGMQSLYAQNVNVAGATSGNGTYPTLTAAFTAINGGIQPGAVITIAIVGNTVEPGPLGAILNSSGVAWTSVTITPTGARTVSGSIAGALIGLNGADDVKIDGVNSGGNSLVINNTSASSIASTVKFYESAQRNQLVNCTILGSSIGSTGSSEGATVLFSTSGSGTGNDNNLVATNDIGPSVTGLPGQAVKSVGTATRENSNNIINNNRIYDFFQNASSNSRGIIASTNSTAWVISSNKIYQTAVRSWSSSGSNVYSCIDIQSGSGYTITGNVLGYANSSGTGYSIFNSSNNTASHLHGMIINQTSATSSTISSNIISGFDISSGRTSSGFPSIFVGIYLVAGTTTVTGNTIGSSSMLSAILIRHAIPPSGAVIGAKPVAGIYSEGGSNFIVNNSIGGMNLSASGPAGFDNIILTGIWNTSPLSVTIQSNFIGGSVANSMTSSHFGGGLVGILNGNATVPVKIYSNTIRNLSHTNANVGVDKNASVIGILEAPGTGTATDTISGNLIYNLSNTLVSSSAVVHVKGILVSPFSSSTTAVQVERNTIYGLAVNSTAAGSTLNGIHLSSTFSASANVFNNMISLGNGISSNLRIFGIYQTGLTGIIYHNSMRIMGAVSSGSEYTAAYSYAATSKALICRNNIFYNERTGGSGSHYAFHTLTNPAPYQASNNLYYTLGPAFAMYNNTAYATLAALSVATAGQNNPTNTKNLPVVFVSPTDLHTSDLNVRNGGLSPLNPAVLLDIDSDLRGNCVDIGCDEFDPGTIPGTAFTWMGTVNSQWCQACNWDRETVPAATDDVIIKDDRTNYPWLQPGVGCGDVEVHDFTVMQNVLPAKSARIDLGVYKLSVTGDIDISGTCLCTGSTPVTALVTGLLDLTGTTQAQSVSIRDAAGNYPGTLCKLRVNKTQPTGAASANHEAYLRGNLIIQYNLDFANGVLISKTAGTFDANESTAVNYKTIVMLNQEPGAVTRQTIGAQNTRNGFFQGRLSRRIKSGAAGDEYLFPMGFRLTGGTGVLSNYFYTPALMKTNSIASSQYLTATYLHDQSNPTADGTAIGFTGHGCLNAFEIDDLGGPTAITCNNKEIDMLSTFYWDFQEAVSFTSGGDPIASPGALGTVDYDLQTAGDVYALLAQDGLIGSELRLLRRPSVVIPGNVGQGPFVTSAGTHNGTNISANTGIAMYSIAAAGLKGARRDGLTTFGGFASAGNGPSPLPVELLYFHAERSGEKDVLCTWETATEINNDHFEVEVARERGGEILFETIGVVQGNGTTSQSHLYTFIDENPSSGKNYYRLRQVDFDGTAGYSKMVVVQFNSSRKFEVIATSPNPFSSNPTMYVQTANGGPLSIRVENSLGQIVFQQELVLGKGSSSLTLQLPASLSTGLYFVRSFFDEEQQVNRLLKQ